MSHRRLMAKLVGGALTVIFAVVFGAADAARGGWWLLGTLFLTLVAIAGYYAGALTAYYAGRNSVHDEELRLRTGNGHR